MRRVLSIILVTIIVFSCIIVFFGCSNESHNTNLSVKTSKLSKKDEGYEFIFVCPMQDNPYWQTCIDGIKRADEEFGTHTTIIGPDSVDNLPEEMAKYMSQAVDEHPDGILAYSGMEQMTEYIDKASKLGIPVVSIDSDALTESRLAYVGTNLFDLGYKAGEKMIDITNGVGKVGFICTYYDMSNEKEVLEAFEDAVQDFDIEVVATAEGHNDIDYATDVTRQMLQDNPDINTIFCTGGVNATAVGKYVHDSGADITVIGLEDTQENLDYVRSGDIDVLLAQTPKEMGYMGVHIMSNYLDKGNLIQFVYNTDILTITKENVDSYNSDSSSVNDKMRTVRVGYYNGSDVFQNGFSDDERKSGYAYEYYQKLSTIAGWKYEYEYGTRAEMIEKLSNSQIDIVAGLYKSEDNSSQFLFSEYDIGLDGLPRYFAVNSDNHKLLQELNSAMRKLKEESPDFLSTLYSKYYGQTVGSQVLSLNEQKFLLNKGEIKFGYVKGNMPFCDEDNQGNVTGVLSDVLDYLSDYTQASITPIAYDYAQDLSDAMKSGEVDAAFPGYSDTWLNENNGLRQTKSMASDRIMLVYYGSYDDNIMDKIAISKTSINQVYYLSSYYPYSKLEYYNSIHDVFDAIKNGKERCTVGCSSVIQRFLFDNQQYDDMHITYLPSTINIGFSVRQEDSKLVNILDKAITSMGDATINSDLMAYSSIEVSPTLMDFVEENSLWFILALSAFVAILLVMFVLYRRQSQKLRKKQDEANRILAEALDIAESNSRAKTLFLSTMSHDIRTPMNAIIGMTDLASRCTDNKEVVENCLEKIRISNHHLLTLINDVLDISMIESGKIQLNPVQFSIKDSVMSLVHIIYPMINERKQSFEIHIHNMMYEMLYADEVRINQIFINLLTNAVKYTPNGGRVTVDIKQEILSDNDKVRITYVVEDSGIGMSPEFMQTMYDMFSRAKDGRTSKIQGTGLGLTIVKQMVELMGGTIECRSEENVGTKFTVTMDVCIANKDENDISLPQPKILVIDKDEIFLENARDTLNSLGAVTNTVSDYVKAVEMVKSSVSNDDTYDVIIVDWLIHKEENPEILGTLRDLLSDTNSVILISTYEWSDIDYTNEQIHLENFISKPLFRSYAYEKISNALNIDIRHVESNTPVEIIKGINLLVAEDNEINWELISDFLSMYGMNATRAENGQDCVEKLTSSQDDEYDIVLMDIQMPVLNGKEATKIIRKNDRDYVRNIPIVAMTADTFAQDIADCLECGMDGHIAKPLNIDKVIHQIYETLKSHGNKKLND